MNLSPQALELAQIPNEYGEPFNFFVHFHRVVLAVGAMVSTEGIGVGRARQDQGSKGTDWAGTMPEEHLGREPAEVPQAYWTAW